MTILCPACLIENSKGTLYCNICGYILSELEDSNNSSTNYPLALKSGSLLKQDTYQIQQTLGQGGFGIVYQALNINNQKTFAIKEFFPERSSRQKNQVIWSNSIVPKDRQEFIKEFLLEGHNLSLCSPYPNIVQIHEWFEENNTGYIVMQLVKGKSLDQILKTEKRLSEAKIKIYFIKIAQTLKIVHQHRLLHRDIKPDNIIINEQDEPILIDFGNAKEYIAGKTQSMSAIATLEYAPLEQLTSYAKRAPSMDFYAVCASMYELITGQLPIPSTERAMKDELKSPREIVSSISPQIEQVILTGLRMRAEDRFQTADELIDALQGKFISPALRRARQLVDNRNLIEAVRAYQSCLQNEPYNGDAATELAIVLLYIDEKQAELAALNAIKINANDGRSHGVIGLIRCRRGIWQDAFDYLKKAVTLAPEESWLQTNFAWAAGKCGSWELAEVAINRAIELHEKSPFTLGIQAWIAFKKKQWKIVIRSARPAIFQAKKLAYATDLYTWLYPYLFISLEKVVSTQQSTDLERCLQEFLTQVPNSSIPWGLKGWMQTKQQRWQEALLSFTKASQGNQSLTWTLLNQGIIHEKLSNMNDAIQAYEHYLEKFSPDVFTYVRLGTLLGKKGEFQQAQYFLENALKIDPNNAEAHHNLGWLLLSLNNTEENKENGQEIISAYRKAVMLYEQQGKQILAEKIKQAFMKIRIDL